MNEDYRVTVREEIETARSNAFEEALAASVRLLSDMIALVDPIAHGWAERATADAIGVAHSIGVEDTREIEMGASLGPIGRMAVPPALLEKADAGKRLSSAEARMVDRIPQFGYELLAKVPSIGEVARIVLYQNERYDGTSFPHDGTRGEKLPVGARILKALNDFRLVRASAPSREQTMEIMTARLGWYDRRVLDAVFECVSKAPSVPGTRRPRKVTIHEVRPGHTLLSDVATTDGILLIGRGNLVSDAMIERIRKFAEIHKIQEPIEVE